MQSWENDNHVNGLYLTDHAHYDLLLPRSSSILKGSEGIIISCIMSPDSLMTVEVLGGQTLPVIFPSAEHSMAVSSIGTTMDASGCIRINIHGRWINSCGYG